MLRSTLRVSVLSVSALVFSLLTVAPSARAQVSAALSAKVIAWANQNIGPYKQYHDFAQHKQHPAVPVPPQVDPPCHLCGDTTQTNGEAQVAAWVAQAQQPEVTYIKGLLAMDRQIQLLGGANSNLLSPAAQKALGQFEDDAGFMSDAVSIAGELVNAKAGPMVQQYGTDPKRAYAGISFILSAGKTLALLGGDNGYANENQLIEDAKTWQQSITDKINDDVLNGHKYNLCPVYASLVRSVELLGGPETDMAAFTQTLQKLQDMVKFNIKLDLKATDQEANGSHFDISWSGTAKMHLNLDLSNSCYTPVIDNGGQMAVQVQNFTMINVATNPDGSKEDIPVTLTSSRSYNVGVDVPLLNLCDPSPILQIPFKISSVPTETIEAKGHSAKADLFGNFLEAVVTTNNINSKATNAVTGAAPQVQSAPAPSSSDNQQMNDAKQQVEAHKGDVNWLMGPQGQAAIAAMQKQVTAQVQNKIAAAGVSAPNVSNMADLGKSIGAAHLDWSNGSATPASKTFHLDKGGNHWSATFTVTQSTQ